MVQQAWKREIKDIICGISGGFLFGIPLMYTMEVWWIGSYTKPPLMLGVLGVTFVINFLLNRTDGFRQRRPDDSLQAAMDSTEALAIGIVCATCMLILLREIGGETPLDEALGKIVFEAVPFSIGVALARTMLTAQENGENGGSNTGNLPEFPSKRERKKYRYQATLADIGATLVGALLIAFNIAPTDEIPMLASAVNAPDLLAVMGTSLIISYMIVFVAGFTTQKERLQQQGIFQHPLVETSVCYLLSLIAAAFMLWFFHRISLSDSWTSWLQDIILLGLPATIGGAAGRLAI
ncbi:integral membrane protein TIGR02587 [Gloeothece citriformis PCC 7424]|uniref:Integral membrane protein TIGR02587 n=1 Tax=Gloeothece citriformis (strain PCC 7424) TaxID=65393 RepID=B7KHM5_GLOC7|nr:TIGR02587 family membrane protein [Gloeothece citriformis]ACK70720.1 integral membrane protein TIGR02587 [Gloeothece citriformis PCC 7424]